MTEREQLTEAVRAYLAEALRQEGVEFAGYDGYARRWTRTDLATDLAPHVVQYILDGQHLCAVAMDYDGVHRPLGLLSPTRRKE